MPAGSGRGRKCAGSFVIGHASGLSHAELLLAVQEAAKRAVLSDRFEIAHEDLVSSVMNRRWRRLG